MKTDDVPAIQSEQLDQRVDIYREYNRVLTNAPIRNSLTDDYQDMATSLANGLMLEYDCRTPTEMALARMAAISYAKVLDYGEELRNCRMIEWHSSQKNGYFTMIAKEVDRANRQFMMAVMALRQAKAPKVEVNVTATNAFMAKEQQFNMNQHDNLNHENVGPK